MYALPYSFFSPPRRRLGNGVIGVNSSGKPSEYLVSNFFCLSAGQGIPKIAVRRPWQRAPAARLLVQPGVRPWKKLSDLAPFVGRQLDARAVDLGLQGGRLVPSSARTLGHVSQPICLPQLELDPALSYVFLAVTSPFRWPCCALRRRMCAVRRSPRVCQLSVPFAPRRRQHRKMPRYNPPLFAVTLPCFHAATSHGLVHAFSFRPIGRGSLPRPVDSASKSPHPKIPVIHSERDIGHCCGVLTTST